MKQAPSFWTVESLQKHLADGPQKEIHGQWVACRPVGLQSLPHRLRLAWLVFTGKADALGWWHQ